MSQTESKGGGLFDAIEAIVPKWLDYKYGRNPNVLYDQYGRPLYASPNGPAPEGSADTARAQALYGAGPNGYVSTGTVLILALGAYLLYQAA